MKGGEKVLTLRRKGRGGEKSHLSISDSWTLLTQGPLLLGVGNYSREGKKKGGGSSWGRAFGGRTSLSFKGKGNDSYSGQEKSVGVGGGGGPGGDPVTSTKRKVGFIEQGGGEKKRKRESNLWLFKGGKKVSSCGGGEKFFAMYLGN